MHADTIHNTFVRITKTGFQAVCGAADFTSPVVSREDAQQFCDAHAATQPRGRSDAREAFPVAFFDGVRVCTDGTFA